MSDLDKQKRTIEDLPGLITVHGVEIAKHKRKTRTQEHKDAISASTKAYYQSPEGIEERKLRSERTKAYWASPEGQAKKERLRKKLKK